MKIEKENDIARKELKNKKKTETTELEMEKVHW